MTASPRATHEPCAMLSYPRIFISAGERSGDRFGARLARALREIEPDVRLSGLGGPLMQEAGVRLAADTVGHAGMGLCHTLRHAAKWSRAFRRCVSEFNRERPDILVPIDNPEFNLKLAALARERRVPVCYYVSPQVWAWRPRRIRKIAQRVTRMMVILPFEKPLYDRLGVDCRYVGHPLLDYLSEADMDEEFLGALDAEKGTVVGILPGSREQEIRHTFPILCDTALLIRERLPETVFHVAAADSQHVPTLRRILDSKGLAAGLHAGRTAEIMKGSRICLVVSGTATLETAYFRTPMVIVYRTGAGRWAKCPTRLLLNVEHIGLVNVIGGREVAPEFLKFDDDPRPVADSAVKLLTDSTAWEGCRAGLDEVMRAMGPAGSSARAAEAVMDCLEKTTG